MAGGIGRADGIALMMTLMASVVLLTIAGVLVPLASTEVAVWANHRRAAAGLYAAEAALEWTVGALGAPSMWRAALAGEARSSVWAGTRRIVLADGSPVDLDERTRALRRDGAGPGAAGRGLAWRLFAHGPLGDLAPLPEGYGAWRVAVWLAREDAVADGAAAGEDGALAVHAAAFDPGHGHRAVQATLVRVSPPLPAVAAPAEYVQLLSWRIVR